MEIIKGLVRKNIPSIIINNLIIFVSFVFADISMVIGLQLNSGVGGLLVLITIAYMLLILITVLVFQVIIDRDVWRNLYKYGLLENEKREIAMTFNLSCILVSFPASILVGNHLVSKLMTGNDGMWKYDLVFCGAEIGVILCAFLFQNRYIRVLYEEKKEWSAATTNEHIPLFLKNVLRNKSKMKLVTGIISFGMIVFNSILFIINCDNSQVYVDKAISVDYFLTGCDTRNTELRSKDHIVEEKDIDTVTAIDDYEDGGRLYHSISPVASLVTNDLPEKSNFSVTYGVPLEKTESGNYFVNLYGADEFVFNNMELYEGSIDTDKLATGNYIIYGLARKAGSLAYVDDVSEEWKYFNVGDEIELEGADGIKQYTIMAICKVNHTYAEQYEYTYSGHELIFYLPSSEYLTYAESAENGETKPMRYLFNTRNSQIIDDKLQGITFESRRKWADDYKKERDAIVNGTFLFAIGCAAIGLFVFINTMIISYIDRKREFEVLANIGMTSGQVNLMILGEGITYGIIISMIIVVCVCFVEAFGKLVLIGESWIYRITMNPMMICAIVIIAISTLTPIVVYRLTR